MAWSADYMLSSREDIEVVRYNTVADLVMALRFKKIDKAAMERPFAVEVLNCVDGLRIIDETIATDGLVFAVNNEREDLLNELNEFFSRFKESKEKKELFERLNSTEGYEYHEIENAKGNRVLSVGLPTDAYPYSYIDFESGNYAGSDLEVITMFANEYGYTLEFTPGIFTTIEIGIGEGEFDVAIGSFCDAAREDAEVSEVFMMSDVYMEHEIVYIEVEDFNSLKIISPLD